MKIRVTLQDLKGQSHPEHDFWVEMPELPQVGDIITPMATDADTVRTVEQWYPNAKEYAAGEFFRVLYRGWLCINGTCGNPFIIAKNMGETDPFSN
jgi:hypothetical protein